MNKWYTFEDIVCERWIILDDVYHFIHVISLLHTWINYYKTKTQASNYNTSESGSHCESLLVLISVQFGNCVLIVVAQQRLSSFSFTMSQLNREHTV